MNAATKALLATALVMASAVARADRDDASLRHLVRHDCGSCHGLRLTGGLGPALTPEAIAGRPAAWLRAVILNGVPGTAMPGWRGVVTEDEAARIATMLEERIHEGR